jgi:hypothetical protein
MRQNTAVALAALATTACGATYAFVPATSATSAIYGHAAADYAIPPQSPHGELRIASYGIEPLSPADAPDQEVGALHLRLFVSDISDQPWTLDTREQEVTLAGHAASTAAFASTSPGPGSSPPVLTIQPNAPRLVDLFFPLPADMQQPSDIPAFQFTSRVHTDQGLVTETTPFERIQTDHDSAYAYDYSAPQTDYNPDVYGYDYWDSPFWYNTGYVGFYGGVGFPRGYGGHPFYARGRGWGRPGYYHGSVRGGHAGGGFHGGGFHGGGGHGGHR